MDKDAAGFGRDTLSPEVVAGAGRSAIGGEGFDGRNILGDDADLVTNPKGRWEDFLVAVGSEIVGGTYIGVAQNEGFGNWTFNVNGRLGVARNNTSASECHNG